MLRAFRFVSSFGLALFLSGSFFLPRIAAAENTCFGSCFSYAQCQSLSGSGWADVGPLCGEDGKTCCVQGKKGGGGQGATCGDQGGYCGVCSGGDIKIGDYECGKKGSGQVCCKPGNVVPPAAPTDKPGAATPDPKAQGGIVIPPVCKATGDCSLNDIISTGVSFATFLMGLSGALFFLIFLIGGGYFLLSFGSSKMVSKGESMMKGAAIGIILVMSAWTIVRYVAGTIAGDYFAGNPDVGTATKKVPAKK